MFDIVKFDTYINEDKLVEEWNSVKLNLKEYVDKRVETPNWKIIKHEFDYSNELCEFFNVKGRPRFYLLEANTTLPQHIDLETQCSLNFILNGNEAPVVFGSKKYTYKYALLNVSKNHGVINNNKDRILFKISIFNESFDKVKEKIYNNKNITICE